MQQMSPQPELSYSECSGRLLDARFSWSKLTNIRRDLRYRRAVNDALMATAVRTRCSARHPLTRVLISELRGPIQRFGKRTLIMVALQVT